MLQRQGAEALESMLEMMSMKIILNRLIESGDGGNKDRVLKLLEKNSSARVLDCGCFYGSFTMEIAKRIRVTEVHGIEIAERFAQQAEQNGVRVYLADLNNPLPIDSETFDVIVANQVIEHLHKTDTFVKEIYRILRRGGVLCDFHNKLGGLA